jgi:hypothetical protein
LLLQARDLVCKSGELRRCFTNLEEFTMHNVTRRAFGKLSTTIAAFALGLIVTLAGFAASAAESESNRVIHWDSFLFPPLSWFCGCGSGGG